MLVGWAAIVCTGMAAICFLAYLTFLGFVIIKTGGTNGLSDVAKAIRAYKVPLLGRSERRVRE